MVPVTGVRWVAVFACAVAALGVVPGAAGAQPPPGEEDSMAAPPPLPAGAEVPVDDGQPDEEFVRETNCVSSLPSTEPLEYKPWGQDLLRFTELPTFATGAGQKVAVIDTGVSDHAYFGGRLEGGGDYVVRDGDGLEDCDGHGTAVAGIIAADPADDAIGFRGIAPAARIVSIRQTSANYQYTDPATNSRRGAGSLGTLAKAVVRAADTDDVTVMNMSVNNCRPASKARIQPDEVALQAALRYAVEERDVVVVASAGNVGEGNCPDQNGADPRNPSQIVLPPWFSDHVLSVGAMTEAGEPAEFSIQGPWVSVAAPGTDIVSLDPANPGQLANQTFDKEGKQAPIQGTSFAAPYVAGLAALVRERFEDLDARQVMHRIKATAAHPAATGGRDIRVGHGMIDPIAALTAFIPAEENIPPDEAAAVPFEMPPPYERDWGPAQVAVIGTATGFGLLLLTLFVVHTVRRNRRPT
ncbi:type VII secretion-associated serine protease mycosin [Actinophytocola glycyrrhizae]|uniref:Type VII secretion-associated serine protease mycosin n=1 Tax=Actinophytocola glycyrrhizae TaxID=2044873 RepID=A0ABV9S5W3_9PSEU